VPRIGEVALRLNVETWIRFRAGWLILVLGAAILYPSIWFGLPGRWSFPLITVVLVAGVSVMCSAIPVASRQVRAAMHYLDLPEKPAITNKAMQSPAYFDVWLLKTREYHRLRREKGGRG
jgi:hypothetical protein